MHSPMRFVARASQLDRDASRTQFENCVGKDLIFPGIVEGLSRYPKVPSLVPEHDRNFDSISLVELCHE